MLVDVMNRNQNNLLTTGHAVSATLETLTATSVPPALAAARTALDNRLSNIKAYDEQQANPLPPRTLERNQQFKVAADAAYVVARLVRGYALAQGLVALAGQVDFSATDLTRGRLTRRLQSMRQVHTAAQAHAAELVTAGVTAEMITDLDAKITAAETVLVAPRTNIAARRVATENLMREFAKLELLLDYTLDPLMEAYGRTDPDAYTRYLTARRVIDRPGTPAVDEDAAPKTNLKPAATPSLAAQPLAA